MVTGKSSVLLLIPILFKETLKCVHLLEEKHISYPTINIETDNLNSLSFIGQNYF